MELFSFTHGALLWDPNVNINHSNGQSPGNYGFHLRSVFKFKRDTMQESIKPFNTHTLLPRGGGGSWRPASLSQKPLPP